MGAPPRERLYQLLPAVYRQRDSAQGEPLRALLAVLESELRGREVELDQLLDDWFVETCREEVLPRIAELVGLRHLDGTGWSGEQRAAIANALRYRRRKGTPRMLEQLARDVTGWPARLVETRGQLALHHALADDRARPATADLRDGDGLGLLDGPFASTPRTAGLRGSASAGPGLRRVELHVWRLRTHRLERATARAVDAGQGRYTFHPLGRDTPLFHRVTRRADGVGREADAPAPLRRLALHRELEQRRRALIQGRRPAAAYFGDEPAFEVWLDPHGPPVRPEEMAVADLSDWRRPATGAGFATPQGRIATRLAVDPELGRLAPAEGTAPPAEMLVSYTYGTPADLGGGPYDRTASLRAARLRGLAWHRCVSRVPDAEPCRVSTLLDAVRAWNDFKTTTAAPAGAIVLTDNRTYEEDIRPARTNELTEPLLVPAGARLSILGAKVLHRGKGDGAYATAVPFGVRPVVLGELAVQGLPPGDAGGAPLGELAIDGVVLGRLRVLPGALGALRVAHATIPPDSGSLEVEAGDQGRNDELRVALDRAVSGPVRLAPDVPSIRVADSIVGAPPAGSDPAPALRAPGAHAAIAASTVFGPCAVRSLEASSSLFTHPVTTARRQMGAVRYSYVPLGSSTPPRTGCVPADAVRDAAALAGEAAAAVPRPTFRSLRFGDPAYATLRHGCAAEVLTGGEDAAQMGAFHHLLDARREALLRARLEEHLPLGLDVTILHAT
jgi:hypothetical protein